MTTPAETTRDLRPAGCGGGGCGVRGPWPLHHVRHRTVFCRLCTSCVLRYHPGSFCASCFDLLLDGGSSPVVRCSRCPSVSHSACLADPAVPFFCPSCSDACGSSYFSLGADKSMDLKSAKVLLAAAQLAAASMGRASMSARADAERKVTEAAVSRKRAREALDRILVLSESVKEKKRREANQRITTVSPKTEAMDPKKKISTVAAMVGQKRVQNRERDRWMRFQEPIGVASKPLQGAAQGKSRIVSLVAMQNHAKNEETEGRLAALPHPANAVGQVERGEKGALKGSQGGIVKDELVVGTC